MQHLHIPCSVCYYNMFVPIKVLLGIWEYSLTEPLLPIMLNKTGSLTRFPINDSTHVTIPNVIFNESPCLFQPET